MKHLSRHRIPVETPLGCIASFVRSMISECLRSSAVRERAPEAWWKEFPVAEAEVVLLHHQGTAFFITMINAWPPTLHGLGPDRLMLPLTGPPATSGRRVAHPYLAGSQALSAAVDECARCWRSTPPTTAGDAVRPRVPLPFPSVYPTDPA